MVQDLAFKAWAAGVQVQGSRLGLHFKGFGRWPPSCQKNAKKHVFEKATLAELSTPTTNFRKHFSTSWIQGTKNIVFITILTVERRGATRFPISTNLKTDSSVVS